MAAGKVLDLDSGRWGADDKPAAEMGQARRTDHMDQNRVAKV